MYIDILNMAKSINRGEFLAITHYKRDITALINVWGKWYYT